MHVKFKHAGTLLRTLGDPGSTTEAIEMAIVETIELVTGESFADREPGEVMQEQGLQLAELTRPHQDVVEAGAGWRVALQQPIDDVSHVVVLPRAMKFVRQVAGIKDHYARSRRWLQLRVPEVSDVGEIGLADALTILALRRS